MHKSTGTLLALISTTALAALSAPLPALAAAAGPPTVEWDTALSADSTYDSDWGGFAVDSTSGRFFVATSTTATRGAQSDSSLAAYAGDDGVQQWQVEFDAGGAHKADAPVAVAVDATHGLVYMVTSSKLAADPGVRYLSLSAHAIDTGAVQWTKEIHSTDTAWLAGLVADPDRDRVCLGASLGQPSGVPHWLLTCYSSAGVQGISDESTPSAEIGGPVRLALDAGTGQLYFAGGESNSVAALRSYDTAGALAWERRISTRDDNVLALMTSGLVVDQARHRVVLLAQRYNNHGFLLVGFSATGDRVFRVEQSARQMQPHDLAISNETGKVFVSGWKSRSRTAPKHPFVSSFTPAGRAGGTTVLPEQSLPPTPELAVSDATNRVYVTWSRSYDSIELRALARGGLSTDWARRIPPPASAARPWPALVDSDEAHGRVFWGYTLGKKGLPHLKAFHDTAG